MARELWKGCEAIAEAAVRAGCRGFFGYPITPQNEIPEYMSWRMPEVGGTFIQAESEIAAVNMVYGASAAGIRCMTSSSSPGISLKQEGISYLAATNLPAVIVNVMRAGPGLGTIQPGQSDYYQATRGGGNGDYRTIVLAPSDLQEAVDLVQDAFDLADQYLTPVMVLADGMIGQMMEPIEWKERAPKQLPAKDWAATGKKGREKGNFVTSLLIDPVECEEMNQALAKKYQTITEQETQYEEYMVDDAEIIITAFGTPSRIARSAAEELRKEGIRAGVFRPITLWPFPSDRLYELACRDHVKAFLDVEMNLGQMIDDVRMAVQYKKPVSFSGRCGGMIPTVEQIRDAAKALREEV